MKFDAKYYDSEYFVGSDGGKTFRRANGSTSRWSYYNPEGEFLGANDIAKAWKMMFNPKNALDFGCGRGTFIAYMRDYGIEAVGFDFSEFAINNPYPRCKKEWIIQHDATEPWPYDDNSFDLVVGLDIFEHIYYDDLQNVIDEMYRVAKKWIFLQIAVVHDEPGHKTGYILKKGEPIPVELEGCAVAGHVTCCEPQWWLDKLDRNDVLFRPDLVEYFKTLVPSEVIKNWLQNLIVVIEKI